jgi:hypothetical protein
MAKSLLKGERERERERERRLRNTFLLGKIMKKML